MMDVVKHRYYLNQERMKSNNLEKNPFFCSVGKVAGTLLVVEDIAMSVEVAVTLLVVGGGAVLVTFILSL